MTDYASEMRLIDTDGSRLYMNAKEREKFLKYSNELENRKHRIFCQLLHWSGARISELLELTGQRVDFENSVITLRTLKKRKHTKQGVLKGPKFRAVPLPPHVLDSLDLVFDVRGAQRVRSSALGLPLWANKSDPAKAMTRVTGWRIIKKVMLLAEIEGKQATPKGFRHGFGVAQCLGGRDIYTLKDIMGHEKAETTALYLQVLSVEAQELNNKYWGRANKGWIK